MKKICMAVAVAAFVLISSTSSWAKPLKVLAIGNSFTGSLNADMPRIAKDCGCELEYCLLIVGGCSLMHHMELAELARTLRSVGVKTVLSVYQHPAVRRSFAGELERAGLKVRSMPIRPIGGRNVQECIQRAGLQTFEKMLANGGVKEDAVVCNDDYLAAGMLSAIDRKGVAMPQGIRFATLANKGLGPVHAQSLTRVEYDPAESGVRIGEAVSTYLDTGKATPCSIAIAFKRGETV